LWLDAIATGWYAINQPVNDARLAPLMLSDETTPRHRALIIQLVCGGHNDEASLFPRRNKLPRNYFATLGKVGPHFDKSKRS